MFSLGFTDLLLIALAAILVVAAVIDVRTFTISNRLNATVALNIAHFSGRGLEASPIKSVFTLRDLIAGIERTICCSSPPRGWNITSSG